MAEVEETELPGVGIRFDLATKDGRQIGVLVHRAGWRDLLVYDAEDPDACAASIRLDHDESRTLAELLGAATVTEHLSNLQQDVHGLAIDWLTVERDSEWAGMSLSEAAVHTNTGVSVVALVRGDVSIAAPGADEVLRVGDTVVAVGTADGISLLARKLRGRPG